MNRYIDIEGNEKDFTYKTELTLSQKTSFIFEVANMVVTKELGYLSILKDVIFDYCVVKYCTDIVLFEKESDFNLDVLERFLNNNANIVSMIKKEMKDAEVLYMACGDAIDYEKSHIEKPDYLGELLQAVAEFLNKASEREINMDIVNKLADIIPVMKDMGSVEVAKSIVKEFHNDTKENENGKVVEMKRKPGRPRKTAKKDETESTEK